tara:strand:+ start:2514 stop:4325 length:1812 start_codon:yes stop_codon:yes gene_type:complete
MCAIFGISGEIDKNLLKRMASVQKHRGPDKTSFFFKRKNNLSLGMNRLAVIDKKFGSQPMFSYDKKIVTIFNGTIYNFIEIKKYLCSKGINFNTNSDTEVLVNSFSYWGNKSFNYFDGMWAAAFYNFKNKKLTLSRDYLGQKPLFYSLINKKLIFSSQLDGIFQYKKNNFIFNEKNSQLYFHFGFVPSPNTLYKNIYQVSPGEIIEFNNSISKKKYWNFEKGPDYNLFFKKKNEQEFKNNFDSLINKFLISDKKSLLSLSGGLDSNILRLKYNELKKDIRNITIGFNNKTYDELKNIKKIKNHNKIKMNNKDIIKTFFKIKKKISFANGDGSLVPSFFLFQNIRKRTNVSNGGDGGDEIFFGYITFKAFWLMSIIKKIIPGFFLKLISKISNKINVNENYINFPKKLKLFTKYIDKNLYKINSYWINDFSTEDEMDLFGNIKKHSEFKKIMKIFNQNDSKMRFCQIFYLKYYLPLILDKIDNASMMNSVENRSIYLSKEFLNFSLDQPIRKIFNIFSSKKILVNLLNNNLKSKIDKKPKHGFAFQKSIILKKKYLIRAVIDTKFLKNPNFFNKKYEEYLSNNNNETYIWNELILNITRQNLEN